MRARSRFGVTTVITMTTLGLLGSAVAPAQAATAAPPSAAGPVAVGSGGAVVSDTPEATDAGLSVLRSGGTAADAAVAVAATLGVTDPYVAGIGGGGYLVYYDARTHRVTTLDGRETTPASAGPDLFIDPATGRPLSFPTAVTSGLSVGVPGTLMTWQRALDAWGRFRLADDLRPAEQVADHGFTVTATLREQTRENASRAQHDVQVAAGERAPSPAAPCPASAGGPFPGSRPVCVDVCATRAQRHLFGLPGRADARLTDGSSAMIRSRSRCAG